MKKILALIQMGLLATTLILLSSCAQNTNQPIGSYPQSVKSEPKHIALLLPLNGPLSPFAQAIKNGFFTAFYQKKQDGYTPIITVYDTNEKDINQVYAAAISDGADFIVGPLEKNTVKTLAQHAALSVPVLALNTLPQEADRHPDNFYEFGLSPRDEAQQVANKIWANQQQHALIIVPDGALGQRVANAFQTQFQGLGGQVIATQYYQNSRTLSDNIQNVLQVKQAYEDKRKIQQIVRQEVRFVPQRRHDFDSIFLMATPSMADQIMPLLRFYFANNIPVYSTSQIDKGPFSDDLNGLMFCDMPWILSPNQMQPTYLQSMQQRIRTIWPENYTNLAKFYALGIDAYDLTLPLKQYAGLPKSGMPAATGTLYVTANQHIYRQLTWAKIQNESLQLMH